MSLSRTPIQKATCLKILKQIIAVKREQFFCQGADKDIFLTNESLATSSCSSNYSSKFSTVTGESEPSDQASENSQKAASPGALSSEEEVFLMNIDYFEQWDRIY